MFVLYLWCLLNMKHSLYFREMVQKTPTNVQHSIHPLQSTITFKQGKHQSHLTFDHKSHYTHIITLGQKDTLFRPS
jgi:hypothetical protein